MKILKRTKGIDLKAKNSIIRGDVTIQLRDAITGKIKFEEKGHNMLTNGINSALNGCPWDMNKIDGCYDGVVGTVFKTTPLFSQLLGGVILFPSALGNDPDLLFPPFSNSPTAYSSMEAYTQTDSKQGTFDSVSSGEITNGFRFVHTWGSAYGNGTIASLGLAPRNAHNWCKDVETMIKPNNGFAQNYPVQGYYHLTNGHIVYAMNKDYILVNDGSWAPVMKCYRNSAPNVNIKLPYTGTLFTDDYTIDGVTIDGCLWRVENMGISYFEGHNTQIIGNYVYTIARNNNTFVVRKFDITDGTLVSTDSYTFSSASFGSPTASIYNGYIYCTKAGGGAILKCNMSTLEVDAEITDPSIEASTPCWCIGTNFIYTWDGILDGDTGVFVPFTSTTKFYKAQNWTSFPLWDAGMWIVGYSYGNGAIGATMKQWGLMTHYDLESSVHKEATTQMIVNYTVTQV